MVRWKETTVKLGQQVTTPVVSKKEKRSPMAAFVAIGERRADWRANRRPSCMHRIRRNPRVIMPNKIKKAVCCQLVILKEKIDADQLELNNPTTLMCMYGWTLYTHLHTLNELTKYENTIGNIPKKMQTIQDLFVHIEHIPNR